MVVEKEDLGLSLTLSLSFPHEDKTVEVSNNHHLDYNHFSTSSPPLIMPFSFISKSAAWPQVLPSSSPGLFVSKYTQIGCTHDKEAEGGSACSPNSTSSSGKRSISDEDNYGCQVDADRACSRGTSDEDEEADNDNSFRNNSNKKLRLSKDQAAVLEETFKDHNTLNPKQKTSLAKRLGLRPRQVEVWFQNRRARTKLKQTEVDCEYLKRCCKTLTEENRRLQKEVQQLRAIKLSPQLYMQMPPTTLTVCPSCDRGAARPWGRAFDGLRSGS